MIKNRCSIWGCGGDGEGREGAWEDGFSVIFFTRLCWCVSLRDERMCVCVCVVKNRSQTKAIAFNLYFSQKIHVFYNAKLLLHFENSCLFSFKKVSFYQKKNVCFYKKNVCFYQKKRVFFTKKVSFYQKKNVYFLIKKRTFF